jgi:hypothetical protein
MEKVVGEIFKSAVDKIELFLRTVASGFIFLFAFITITKNHQDLLTSNLNQGIGLAIISGFSSYALHTSVLEDLWMEFVVIPNINCKCDSSNRKFVNSKYSDFVDTPISVVVAILSRQRWFRRASRNHHVFKMQEQLDKIYAWLILIYCSSYLLILLGLVLIGKSVLAVVFIGKTLDIKILYYILSVVIGIILLFFAVIQDIKITKHELWLCENLSEFEKYTKIKNPYDI